MVGGTTGGLGGGPSGIDVIGPATPAFGGGSFGAPKFGESFG